MEFNVGRLSNFSNDEMSDLYEAFQDVATFYNLRNISNENLDIWSSEYNAYDIGAARNSFIDIICFQNFEDIIDDVKIFISQVKSLGFIFPTSSSFTHNIYQNINNDKFIAISMCFCKDPNISNLKESLILSFNRYKKNKF